MSTNKIQVDYWIYMSFAALFTVFIQGSELLTLVGGSCRICWVTMTFMRKLCSLVRVSVATPFTSQFVWIQVWLPQWSFHVIPAICESFLKPNNSRQSLHHVNHQMIDIYIYIDISFFNLQLWTHHIWFEPGIMRSMRLIQISPSFVAEIVSSVQVTVDIEMMTEVLDCFG